MDREKFKLNNKKNNFNFDNMQDDVNEKSYSSHEDDIRQQDPLENSKVINHNNKKTDRKLLISGIVVLGIGILSLVLFPISRGVSSKEAMDALDAGYSTSIRVGTVIADKGKSISEKDYNIAHNSNSKDTKIWVWDYASEDGDYVQIYVDGNPICEPFFIKNKPREFTVPSVGKVQVKGVKDGGGGITYAVRYEVNGTTYFNDAPENDFNTYTLSRE